MNTLRSGLLRLLAVVVSFVGLPGCSESYQWNQELTVTVETPSGEVSGSSVTQVTAVGGGKRWGMDGANSTNTLVGEATVVDLGGGRILFAIFESNGKTFKGIAKHMAEFAFCSSKEMSPGAACFAKLRDLPPGTTTELKLDNYPMLVTFDDINDPKTVKQVDPANLAATFGEGFALKSMLIERTNEPVSKGKLESLLAWIVSENPRFVSSKEYPFDHPLRRISKLSFKSGAQ